MYRMDVVNDCMFIEKRIVFNATHEFGSQGMAGMRYSFSVACVNSAQKAQLSTKKAVDLRIRK